MLSWIKQLRPPRAKLKPTIFSRSRSRLNETRFAREGDTVTPDMLAQFAAIKSTGTQAGPGTTSSACCWLWLPFTGRRGSLRNIEHTALSLSKRKAFALVGSAIVVETALMRVGFTFGDSVAARMQARRSTIPHLELRNSLCRSRVAGRDAGRYATRLSDRNRHGAFCRHAGAERNADGALRDGFMFRSYLWHRTVSRAAIRNACRTVCRRCQRGDGPRADRLC